MFKTARAFQNHQLSKKHKDNIDTLKESVSDDDLDNTSTTRKTEQNSHESPCDYEIEDSCLSRPSESIKSKGKVAELVYSTSESAQKKKNRPKPKHKNIQPQLVTCNFDQKCESEDVLLNDSDLGLSKKQKKKVLQQQFLLDNINQSKRNKPASSSATESCETSTVKHMQSNQMSKSNDGEDTPETNSQKIDLSENNESTKKARSAKDFPVGLGKEISCVTCKCSFPSKK